jgi:hypothetical protein
MKSMWQHTVDRLALVEFTSGVSLGLILFVLITLGTTVWLQQNAISALIASHAKAVEIEQVLSNQVQAETRRANDLEERVVKLEEQLDLIASASRMGWPAASRMLVRLHRWGAMDRESPYYNNPSFNVDDAEE